MSKTIQIIIFFLITYFNFALCSNELIELELYQVSHGSLKDNEYDYYVLTVPDNFDREGHLIIELEPNKQLDFINNIMSDPNLYVSTTEKMPSINSNTWKSQRFGDETISIDPSFLNPSQIFYISVHCKEKCNYILKSQIIKDIVIKEGKMNHYNLNPKTVNKFTFTTKSNFNELYINVVGSYINSFRVYLSTDNPSSSNTLPAEPIIFNGYRFTITKFNKLDNLANTDRKFFLVVDNNNDMQDLTIWLQYDYQNILVREAEILYDSLNKSKAHCYYYPIDNLYKDKDIILSTSLFNGQGFIYMGGFNSLNADSIKLEDKKKSSSYVVIQNKAIRLTKNEFKNFGQFKESEQTYLNFCFYAEEATSLSMKVYFLENYKRLQALNIIYPGIGVEDIIPNNSLKKYKLEHFNIERDISINLEGNCGKPKLYLFMAKPDEDNRILDFNDFENFKKNEQVIEANYVHNSYNLYLTKELNKCKKNQITGLYSCYLDAVVECQGDEYCSYYLTFDHSKKETYMQPKKIYSNIISENENDNYKIVISDASVKNLVIVLMQNTGKSLLRLEKFTTELGIVDLNENIQNDEFLPNLMKISNKQLKVENLIGTFIINVKGLSYASYSIYYYTYNEEESKDALDQDKVTMKLEKGRIIRDIFLDSHRFKVYIYDSSIIGNKSNLFIGLVETDYTNLELYIFKDLNDFYIFDDNIRGYLWKGDYRDNIYIDKDDKSYKENDILYIMIFKKMNYVVTEKKDSYTSFYLGITDENTPLLLNEGVEFRYYLSPEHFSQKFYYYFINEQEKEQDVQISLSIYSGHVIANILIENSDYGAKYIIEDSSLITIKADEINKYCKKQNCGIGIEIQNDNSFLEFSSFLISARSAKNSPIYLKQGVINRRTILSGETQHFIIDLKPDKAFGAKISAMFLNGQGELYARRLLRSEIFENTNFPDEKNYEYKATYENSINDFFLIEIPYIDFGGHSHCQLLLTVKGIFPGYYYTKIEYSLSVSSSIYEIITDKNYKLFISKGEVQNFHFKIGINKKRLYVSMSNKDKDANMFLTNDQYSTNIYEYQWKSSGSYNEYLDLTINDQYFAERGTTDLDGDYYLAIQGVEDTFYNLYISSQDVKIITLAENTPGGCECETENDICYFRYENINNPLIKEIYKKKIIFYTEFTYGRGSMHAKLYKNGNMDEILNNLPSESNNDAFVDDSSEFLLMELNQEDPKNSYDSVVVVGVQCKEKSLFDLSAVLLDKTTDVTRYERNTIFLKFNMDNIYYLSYETGITTKFCDYISMEEDMNFHIKTLLGKAKIHTYINNTYPYYYIGGEQSSKVNNYHHISDFEIDSNIKGKNEYFGKVPKEYGHRNYLYIEIKPITDCLINMNINYDEEMKKIPLNKEIIGILNSYNYYAYYDFNSDIEEVIITITSQDKDMQYDVYIKKNVINKNQQIDEDLNKYSKASSQNYDLKGRTNDLTSAISLRVKNAPKSIRTEAQVVRVLINIEALYYSYDKKIQILVTPIINNVKRIKPEQNTYVFSGIEDKNVEKTVFNLKNTNQNNDLMIIEISSCKGDFLYSLTDTPPLDSESYHQLQEKKLPSIMNSFHGKKRIVVNNLEQKDYYLTLFGANSETVLNLFINGDKRYKDRKIEVLFYYFTTNRRNYNYLTTHKYLTYESKDDFYSLKLKINEVNRKDVYGKDNNIKSIYTLIVSDEKEDYKYMESICYLTKLQQKNQNEKYSYLTIKYDEESSSFNIKGLKAGKEYYMNVLEKNEQSGEVITYSPIVVMYSKASERLYYFIIIFLVAIMIFFIYGVYYIYRKYRLQKVHLNFIEEKNSGNSKEKKRFRNLSNINIDFVKESNNNIN